MHQAKRERRLIVFANPHRMREFRQPGSESVQRGLFEGSQVPRHLSRLQIVPFPQLSAQLQ
jgi:hypothetical protein